MEGCLERIGEDDPDGEMFLRDLWEEGEPEMVLATLQVEGEILPVDPRTTFLISPKLRIASSEAFLKAKSLTLQLRDAEV